MSRKSIILIASLATLVAIPALAKDHCTNAPRADWKPLHDISSHAAGLGYSIFGVEREGSCYEVEGLDKNGAKIKILYNPQTGEPMPRSSRR